MPCFNSASFLFISRSVFAIFSVLSGSPFFDFFISDLGLFVMNSFGGSKNLGTMPSFCRRISDDDNSEFFLIPMLFNSLRSLSLFEMVGDPKSLVGVFLKLRLTRYGLLLLTLPMKLLLACRLLIYSIFCCYFLYSRRTSLAWRSVSSNSRTLPLSVIIGSIIMRHGECSLLFRSLKRSAP